MMGRSLVGALCFCLLLAGCSTRRGSERPERVERRERAGGAGAPAGPAAPVAPSVPDPGAEVVDLLASGRNAEAKERLQALVREGAKDAATHNNLGVLFLRERDFYHAAWEFQIASKLNTESGDPLHNLGVLYEGIGRGDDAVSYYERSLAVDGTQVETMENLARLYVGMEIKPEETRVLLDEIALRDARPEWQAWVGRHRLRLGKAEPAR
ncbi:MAG: tetratricopeptide repeat protein [Planctomycetes bacterium]|nr:tetratricopeptide repeat protein [Planctomycetota bacterium]